MERTFLSPPAKRTISGLPDANPNDSSKRSRVSSKPPQPTLPVPPGHVAFRLLCQASRIGGVIGKSGAIIKSLQLSTGAKIRVEDAPAEVPDRLIVVVGASSISGKILLSGGEDFEVSKAQEALLKVFDRILEVAAETEGIEVGDRVVCCRLVADEGQVGSVIGKGGKVVDKIRKDFSCRIRVFTDSSAPSTSSFDEVIEIEGNVSSVKKALVAVSRRLQDFPPPDRTKMVGSKPHEMVQNETSVAVPHETLAALPHKTYTAVPRETLTDLHADHLLQRGSVLSSFSSSSNSYANGVRSLSTEDNIVTSKEPKVSQLEVSFRILCSNDKVGGVIGKGGSIVKALKNETGATIGIGPSVAECEDRVITVTASESSESKYSPAQKALLLVYTRSVEAGIEKGLDSGSKGSSVTARLLVPSNQVGCLLGKGGVIVSEMRKTTGTSIRIIGTDQVPKCASDNDQVVLISGEFSCVQDALYNATGRLRDNLIISTQSGAGTRSLSSAQADDTGPYGQLRDMVPLGGQPALGVSHSLSRHILPQSIDHDLSRHTLPQSLDHHDLSRRTLPQGLDHHDLSRRTLPQGLDHQDLSRRTLPQSIDHHDLSWRTLPQSIDHHDLSWRTLPQSIDHHDLSRRTLPQSLDHHDLSRRTLPQSLDHHDLSWRTLPQSIDHHDLSRRTFPQSIDHLDLSRLDYHELSRHTLSQGVDHHELSRHTLSQGVDHHDLNRHTLPHSIDHHELSRHTLSQSVDHHDLSRHTLSQSIDHHDLSRHTLSQSIDHNALAQNLDHPYSPGLWEPSTAAGINSRGINDVSWALPSRKGGLELVSGSKSAIVTNTTVEIVVPEHTIDSVYGENGSNLARLRQISGAKVVVHEPRPGGGDRTIVISGTPDETQAAQSLLQAFIISGSS